MSQVQSPPRQRPASSQRRMLILHLTMVGLFLLDLALPRDILLLPYCFLVVLLSVSTATPRRMLPLIVQAYVLAIASGIYEGFFPSLDSITRLVALSAGVAVAVQLSAQRSREMALRREAEETLRLTIDNAAAGIGLADARGRILRVNPALCTMLGRDADSLQEISWPDITHPEDVE